MSETAPAGVMAPPVEPTPPVVDPLPATPEPAQPASTAASPEPVPAGPSPPVSSEPKPSTRSATPDAGEEDMKRQLSMAIGACRQIQAITGEEVNPDATRDELKAKVLAKKPDLAGNRDLDTIIDLALLGSRAAQAQESKLAQRTEAGAEIKARIIVASREAIAFVADTYDTDHELVAAILPQQNGQPADESSIQAEIERRNKVLEAHPELAKALGIRRRVIQIRTNAEQAYKTACEEAQKKKEAVPDRAAFIINFCDEDNGLYYETGSHRERTVVNYQLATKAFIGTLTAMAEETSGHPPVLTSGAKRAQDFLKRLENRLVVREEGTAFFDTTPDRIFQKKELVRQVEKENLAVAKKAVELVLKRDKIISEGKELEEAMPIPNASVARLEVWLAEYANAPEDSESRTFISALIFNEVRNLQFDNIEFPPEMAAADSAVIADISLRLNELNTTNPYQDTLVELGRRIYACIPASIQREMSLRPEETANLATYVMIANVFEDSKLGRLPTGDISLGENQVTLNNLVRAGVIDDNGRKIITGLVAAKSAGGILRGMGLDPARLKDPKAIAYYAQQAVAQLGITDPATVARYIELGEYHLEGSLTKSLKEKNIPTAVLIALALGGIFAPSLGQLLGFGVESEESRRN